MAELDFDCSGIDDILDAIDTGGVDIDGLNWELPEEEYRG